ncbi:hypothetical protein [Thermoflexus hugenholtzii]
MSGRWKAVGLVVGLLLGACGAPGEQSSVQRSAATAPVEAPVVSPSPAPTRTRFPTLTPAPLAFRPQPLPEGFRTEDHWLAVRVVREFAKERTAYTGDTYAIWFTDGQRWLGPVPEVGLYITRLERAFWRRAGGGWELCAQVAVQPTLGAREASMMFCTSAPPGVGPKEAPPASLEASPCPDGRSLCVTQSDGTVRALPLPEDLFRPDPSQKVEKISPPKVGDEGVRMEIRYRTTERGGIVETRIWKPVCGARGRWVVVDFAVYRHPWAEDGAAGGGLEHSELYIADLSAETVRPLGALEARGQLVDAFRAEGRIPFVRGDERFSMPNHLLPYVEGGCSPDGSFLLFSTGADESGMLGFPLSWVARLEDRVIYPLPGDQARWVEKSP